MTEMNKNNGSKYMQRTTVKRNNIGGVININKDHIKCVFFFNTVVQFCLDFFLTKDASVNTLTTLLEH